MRLTKIIIPMFFILLGTLLIGGCPENELVGDEHINNPPVVNFINIPVEGAKFSADAVIYWYGTDIDGFIVEYQYAVVESTIVGNPETYLNTAADIPWVTLKVNVNDPQTNATVTMSADISDPVRTFVSSYVFLRAFDDKNAVSKTVYRMYFKNNHFPQTAISAQGLEDPYVNTVLSGGVLEGVRLSWSATDPIDYPEDPPPFEYQWKLFGPYDSSTMDLIESTYVENVFVDNYGDSYYDCDPYPTLITIDTFINTDVIPPETTITPDTTFTPVCSLSRGNAFGNWEERFLIDSFMTYSKYRLVDESYDPFSGENWVMDVSTNIYDLYRNYDSSEAATDGVAIDTTVQLNFLFWCQARDDSKVPDPVPARKWFSAIEPKFEREVIIIDATPYNYNNSGYYNWPLFHQRSDIGQPYVADNPLVRDKFNEYILRWIKGIPADSTPVSDPSIFDAENTLSNYTENGCNIKYGTFDATQDYYPIYKLNSCDAMNIEPVVLRDILKHKIILLIKDNVGGEILMDSPMMLSVLDGLNAGMSCWSMVRSPFVNVGDARQPIYGGFMQEIPTSYQNYFGITSMKYSGWAGAINWSFANPGIRVEDFVGTYVLPEFVGTMPVLNVDTTLLESRYLWKEGGPGFNLYDFRCRGCDTADIGTILIGALPDVGYVVRSTYADPIYLIRSIYGQSNVSFARICCRDVGHWYMNDGSVAAVRYDAGVFKTAHFSFSLLPFNEDSAQMCFNNMMDWMSDQPYIQAAKTGVLNPTTPVRVDIEQLRRESRKMHELKAQGLLRSYYGGE